MDPLSITASVIAVVGVANSCVTNLRASAQAPAELLSLANDISDLNTVLTQVIVLCQHYQQVVNDVTKGSLIALKNLLKHAEDHLLELHGLVQKSLEGSSSARRKVSHLRWIRNKDRVILLQDRIRSTRLNLSIVIGTANFHTLARVQLAFESFTSAQTADYTLAQRLVDQMSATATVQDAAAESSTASSIAQLWNRSINPLSSATLDLEAGRLQASQTASTIQLKGWGPAFPVLCSRWCSCACHRQRNIRLSNRMRTALGGLIVNYAGLPVFTPSCSETKCSRRSAPRVDVTYHFPAWLLARVLSLHISLSPLAGLELSLRMPRMVSWATPLWRNSALGDTQAIQVLFSHGRASPFDVNAYGQSALHYAADTACIELCGFLVQQKADVYLRDENGRRPIDSAWDRILSKRLEPRVASELSNIFLDREYLESRQFSTLHKALLELTTSSVAVQLEMSTSEIDSVDGNGRTCLSWAAARGDAAAVRTLLEYGANPDLADEENSYPLFHAVAAESVPCVALFLKSMVDSKVVTVYGETALHRAVRCKTPDILEMLVKQGGFDVDATDNDRDTPLNYVARAGAAHAARCLLDAGADPTIANVYGDTPMHTATYCETLEVLKELVRHGADFGCLNPLRDASPLHHAARCCDSRMLEILKRASSLRDADPYAADRDGLNCFDYLKVDGDEVATQKRHKLFREFLYQIGKEDDDDDDDDEEVFHDALAVLHL